MALKGYADLTDLSEDDRIRIIAETAMEGKVVGFMVDDDIKADRYIEKLKAFPVRLIDRNRLGQTAGSVVYVRVGPKES